jgi:hypothetical protein
MLKNPTSIDKKKNNGAIPDSKNLEKMEKAASLYSVISEMTDDNVSSRELDAKPSGKTVTTKNLPNRPEIITGDRPVSDRQLLEDIEYDDIMTKSSKKDDCSDYVVSSASSQTDPRTGRRTHQEDGDSIEMHDDSLSGPGAFSLKPKQDDMMTATVNPVSLQTLDGNDKDNSPDLYSDRFVLAEATMVESTCIEATMVDVEKETKDLNNQVQELLEKERQNQATSSKKKKMRFLAIMMGLILIVTGVTLGLLLGLKKDDENPPPPSEVVIQSNTFSVKDVLDNGALFSLPLSEFILPFDSIETDEKGEILSTLRVRNSRTSVVKAIMVKKEMKADKTYHVKGWYNPSSNAQPNDFQVGDILTAIDYAAFIDEKPENKCSRVPYHVRFVTSSGFDRDPQNIRLGRVGLVGEQKQEDLNQLKDFDVVVEVETPVSKLWTDAVDSDVSILQEGSWANWPKPVSAIEGSDPTIRPFVEPLTGRFRICYKDVGTNDLNGLVSISDGGGVHIALCA